MKIPRYISCPREILPSQSSSVYLATRRLRLKARRLQGNRHRISKQHDPATSLANVGCKKRPISPAGINDDEEEEEHPYQSQLLPIVKATVMEPISMADYGNRGSRSCSFARSYFPTSRPKDSATFLSVHYLINR